jgi:sugar lactone lactonase YvrE
MSPQRESSCLPDSGLRRVHQLFLEQRVQISGRIVGLFVKKRAWAIGWMLTLAVISSPVSRALPIGPGLYVNPSTITTPVAAGMLTEPSYINGVFAGNVPLSPAKIVTSTNNGTTGTYYYVVAKPTEQTLETYPGQYASSALFQIDDQGNVTNFTSGMSNVNLGAIATDNLNVFVINGAGTASGSVLEFDQFGGLTTLASGIDVSFNGLAVFANGDSAFVTAPGGIYEIINGQEQLYAAIDLTGPTPLSSLVVPGEDGLFCIDAQGEICEIKDIPGNNVTIRGTLTATRLHDGYQDGFFYDDGGFGSIDDIVVDPNKNIFVADAVDQTVREIYAGDDNWEVTTVAGLGEVAGNVDGLGAAARFNQPTGISLDGSGNLYVADFNNGVVRMGTPVGTPGNVVFNLPLTPINAVVGQSVSTPFSEVLSGPATISSGGILSIVNFTGPGLVVLGSGTGVGEETQLINVQGAPLGVYTFTTPLSGNLPFNQPMGVAADAHGNFYVADTGNNRVCEVAPSGTVTVLGATMTNPPVFSGPEGVAVDQQGDVFVADTGNARVCEFTANGGFQTLGAAGTFSSPTSVAVDTQGNIFVADPGNDEIFELDSSGDVTFSAGTQGVAGNEDSSDGNALFNAPHGVAVDGQGNVYVADTGNGTVRKITFASSGGVTISTLRDDILGNAFTYSSPEGVAVDASGNVFVSDGNDDINEISSQGRTGVTGGGFSPGFQDGSGDPNGVNLYPSDPNDHGVFYSEATFDSPAGLAVDPSGNVYVADAGNNAVRVGLLNVSLASFSASPPPNIGQQVALQISDVSNTQLLYYTLLSGPATITGPDQNVVTRTGDGPIAITVAALTPSDGSSGWYGHHIHEGDAGTPPGQPVGSLQVTLTPQGAVNAAAKWRMDGGAWQTTGTSLGSISTGTHIVSFSTVSGYATPDDQTVTVNNNVTTPATGIYYPPSGTPQLGYASGSFSYNYTGNAQGPTPSISPSNLAVTYAYTGQSSTNQSYSSSQPPTSPGSYAVTVTSTVYPSISASATFTLNAAPLTITANNASKVQGQSLTLSAFTPSGLVNGDTIDSVVLSSAGTDPAAAVGTYPISISGATGVHFNPANYAVTYVPGTLSVIPAGKPQKATVKLTGLAAMYDGNSHAAIATTTPAGLNVALTYQLGKSGVPTATAPTAAGSYTVAATITSPGYTGTGKGTLVISKGAVTVTVGTTTVTYDAAPQGVQATTSVPVQGLTYKYGRSATPPANAGSYAVTATVSDPNYAGTGSGTLVIAKATATVTLNFTSPVVYTGKAPMVSATSSVPGTITYTYNGSTKAPVAPGMYTVVGKVSTANVQGTSAPGTLVINKAPATITLSGLSAVYNKKAHAVKATTVPGRLPVVITYNGSTVAPIAVNTYSVVAQINSPDYTGMQTGTLTISAPRAIKAEVAAAGNAAAGLKGAAFLSFDPPAVNALGGVAFAATLAIGPGHITAKNDTGIWAEDSSGQLQLIAQTSDAATGYLTLGDPVYNNNSATAFVATYLVGRTVTTGLFCNSAGPLELVAQSGDQAAGYPDGAKFTAFTALALPDRGGPTDKGGVVFLGTIAGPGVTGANSTGLWMVDRNATLQLLVRTGDLIAGKTVASLGLAQDGAVTTYNVTFTDGSAASFDLEFP